jgi:hypothetical protein
MADKANAQTLDFTNVKDRGDYNPVHIEAGEYALRVDSVVDGESKQGNAQWVFAFKFAYPDQVPATARRGSYPYYCVLDAKSLWKIRGLAQACGMVVPKSRFKLDPNRLIGKIFGAILEDDEYEGRLRSKVLQVMPLAELEQHSGEAENPGDVDEGDLPTTPADPDEIDL